MTGRGPVVVLEHPAGIAGLADAVAAAGHDVTAATRDSLQDQLPILSEAAGIIMDARWLDDPAGEELLRQVAVAPSRPLVAFDQVEAAGLRRAFACGALGWVPGAGPAPTSLRKAAAEEAAAVALDALRADLADEPDRAFQALATIQGPEATTLACSALVEVGAQTFDRFRSRARHPVALDVLVSHLTRRVGMLDGPDYSWWWTMTEHMAFRSAGVVLPASHPDPMGERSLVGAFHAAGTVLRFTSRRQWRRAQDLFDDVTSSPLAGCR
jgi:hypothetical protein